MYTYIYIHVSCVLFDMLDIVLHSQTERPMFVFGGSVKKTAELKSPILREDMSHFTVCLVYKMIELFLHASIVSYIHVHASTMYMFNVGIGAYLYVYIHMYMYMYVVFLQPLFHPFLKALVYLVMSYLQRYMYMYSVHTFCTSTLYTCIICMCVFIIVVNGSMQECAKVMWSLKYYTEQIERMFRLMHQAALCYR